MQGISTKTLFEQNNLKPGVDQLSSMTTRRNKKSTAGRTEIKKKQITSHQFIMEISRFQCQSWNQFKDIQRK